MTIISMRTLSRETARVLDELAAAPRAMTVTRDGKPVARIVPMSAIEQEMYAHLIAAGVDPDNPPPVDASVALLPSTSVGHKSASEGLQAERDSYYDAGE